MYSKQKYDKGLTCWNGPERSVEVRGIIAAKMTKSDEIGLFQVLLRCGVESQLVEATEPGRCEYRFIFETPVACKDPTLTHEEHTEL